MSGKPLPILTSDEEAERFVEEADLSEYDLSKGRWIRLDFADGSANPKTMSVTLARADIEEAQRRAASEGIALDAYLGRLLHDQLAS